jgi:hypothetical protein
MRLSIYPAEFRHLLSFGRRGAEPVHLRDSDTLIDSRDSKKETERESQTPINQTSLVSKFARRASRFDTTIEANPATPEFGTANDTLFQQHRSIIFGIPRAVVSATDAVGLAISR